MALEIILEIAGTVVGLAYIWLEYRASIWLWLAGIVMPAIYIYVYYAAGLYADMGIQVYYLAAGFWGWAIWLGKSLPVKGRGGENPSIKKEPLTISHTPRRYILPLLAIFVVCFSVIAWILINFTDSNVPYGDSFTTALSIVALWMLARKYAEQWLVWIVVDVVCCGLYAYKELWFTAMLYGLYSIIALLGYYKWRRIIYEQNGTGI